MSVANQTIEFGGRTRANAGGAKALDNLGAEVNFIAVTAQGGATRTWSVSAAGRLIANNTPDVDNGKVLTCTTSFGAISVTIKSSGLDAAGNDLAHSFSVCTWSELKAASELTSATVPIVNPDLHLQLGDNILLRTGDTPYNVDQLGTIARIRAPYGTWVPPVLVDEAHPRKGHNLDSANFIKITKHAGASPVVAKIRIDGNAYKQQYFRITNLQFHIPALIKPATGGSWNSAAVHETAGATHIALDNCEMYSEFDNAAANILECYSGINFTTTTGPIYINDNYIHHVTSGISATGSNLEVVGNHVNYYSDNAFMVSPADDCLFAWNWCENTRPGSGLFPLHTDMFQIANDTPTNANLQIIGNRFQLGATESGSQGIFGEPESIIFNGYISGTTMTVTVVTLAGPASNPTLVGGLDTGMGLGGTGIAEGTMITGRIGGTGGVGTYSVNNAQTYGSSGSVKTMSAATRYMENAIIAGNIIVLDYTNVINVARLKTSKIMNNTAVKDPYAPTETAIQIANALDGNEVSYNIANQAILEIAPTYVLDTKIGNITDVVEAVYAEFFVDPQSLGGIADPTVNYRVRTDNANAAHTQTPIKAGAYPAYVNFTTRETYFPWEGASVPTSFNFPNAPTEGQEYTPSGGPTYIWESPRWLIST